MQRAGGKVAGETRRQRGAEDEEYPTPLIKSLDDSKRRPSGTIVEGKHAETPTRYCETE